MFLIKKSFNTLFIILLIATYLPSTQADEQQIREQEISAPVEDQVAREELAKEAIDGQVAHDSYRNEWQLGGGPVVHIATAEDVYQAVPISSLAGRKVVNLNAKSVGKVHDVVLTGDEGTTGLIIETGGFFGIGAAESLVPLEHFYFVGEQLVWETHLTKGELKKTNQFDYDEKRMSSLLDE